MRTVLRGGGIAVVISLAAITAFALPAASAVKGGAAAEASSSQNKAAVGLLALEVTSTIGVAATSLLAGFQTQ